MFFFSGRGNMLSDIIYAEAVATEICQTYCKDLDIAIAIADWQKFEEISNGYCADGWF